MKIGRETRSLLWLGLWLVVSAVGIVALVRNGQSYGILMIAVGGIQLIREMIKRFKTKEPSRVVGKE
jgi:hypothetical protein